MTETDQINSLQDGAIVMTAVFVSIFLVISFIWIFKYYCCPSTSINPTTNNFSNTFMIYNAHLSSGNSGTGTTTTGDSSPSNQTFSEHPVVPFSTKVRSKFLEKVLQHETFHPHKSGSGHDVEKGIQTITLPSNIDHRPTPAECWYELPTKTTEDVITRSTEDLMQTDENNVDVVDICTVSECETTMIVTGSTMGKERIKDDIEYSNSTEYMNDSCAICYETLQDGDDVTTSNCSKTFHRTCIITWLMQHDTCPYCRNTFKNINDKTSIDAILAKERKIIDCD